MWQCDTSAPFSCSFFFEKKSCSLWFAKSISFPLAVFGIVFLNFPCQHCKGCWSLLVWNLASSRRARCKCRLAAHQAPSCVFRKKRCFLFLKQDLRNFLVAACPLCCWLDAALEKFGFTFRDGYAWFRKEFATWGKGFLVFPPLFLHTSFLLSERPML